MGILNLFNTLTLKQIFWKTQTFLKELEYHFLVESIDALSEGNVKKQCGVKNGLITKNGVMPVITLFFQKEPRIKCWFDVATTQSVGFLFEGAFNCESNPKVMLLALSWRKSLSYRNQSIDL